MSKTMLALAVVAAGLTHGCAKTYAQPPDSPALRRPAAPPRPDPKAPSPPSDNGKRYF